MKTTKRLEKIYESILLKLAEKHLPTKRKRKYTNKYFLDQFKHMLTDLVSWDSLTNVKNYPSEIAFHYKYLNQIFNKWVKLNLFKNAYEQLLKEHYFKLQNILHTKSLTLFIDCTYIVNKYGSNHITKNPENKKKK